MGNSVCMTAQLHVTTHSVILLELSSMHTRFDIRSINLDVGFGEQGAQKLGSSNCATFVGVKQFEQFHCAILINSNLHLTDHAAKLLQVQLPALVRIVSME